METFESYLMEKFVRTTTVLDDDIPDKFPDWLEAQDPQDLITWAIFKK